MKQGQASSSKMGSTKVEPKSHAVSPSVVSQIGLKQGNHFSDEGGTTGRMAPKTSVYEGRGLSAPMVKSTVHKSGSQRG